jgi:hypothetical protein
MSSHFTVLTLLKSTPAIWVPNANPNMPDD